MTEFLALMASLALGLRHATDPDHLTAISTLVVGEPDQGARRAARLGLAWGTGHALTLLLLGLPVVLFQRALPNWAGPVAETLVGLVIMALAVRLLLRWNRGFLHARQPGTRVRTGREALGVGLLHGAGGSGAAGAMLIGTAAGPGRAALALLVFAAGTAISMGVASGGVGLLLGGPARARGFQRLVPLIGLGSLGFGIWYAAVALMALPIAVGGSPL